MVSGAMPAIRDDLVRHKWALAVAVVTVAALLAGAVVLVGGEDEPALALVRDIEPGEASGHPSDLAVLGGTLYFRTGRDLWRSDGTAAGTEPVTTIPASGEAGADWVVSGLVAAEDALYFWHWDRAREQGFELWRSDGTAAGTGLIVALPRRGQNPSAGAITSVGHALYFLYDDGTVDQSLWTSDGTAAGTRPLANIGTGVGIGVPDQEEITVAGDALYFAASADGGRNVDLWRFDIATERAEIAVDAYPMQMAAFGDALFFVTPVSDTAYELWRTDGTPDGTTSVMSLGNTTLFELAAAGDGLYVLAPGTEDGFELWWTDGTADGTRQLSDLPEGSSLSGLIVVGDSAYFLARSGEDGSDLELWISDGTAEGTRRIGETGLRVVREVVATGDPLFFAGEDDGKHGDEFWSYEIPSEEM